MFKKITKIGLPYHGLVVDGVLTLDNQKTIEVPGISNGDTQVVSFEPPENIAISNSPKSIEWRSYALVADNYLGGVHLGLGWLLYIDPNRVVWYLKLGYQVTSNQCHMNCTLISAFGRFNQNLKPINIELTNADTKFEGAGILKTLNRFTFERKHDGSEVLIHIYVKLDGANSIELPEEMTLWEVWKLELKGSGQLSDNKAIGSGITANLARYKRHEELKVINFKTVPRIESRCRVAKTNLSFEFEPKETIPPECARNSCHSTFDLVLVDENDNFEPFGSDRNVYIKSNWYGEAESSEFIVRMLYDASGKIREMSVRREKSRLNRFYSDFSGRGKGTQGPIEYFFNGYACIVNGYMPGWHEEYSGIQTVKVQNRIEERVSLLIDREQIATALLEGEITQKAITRIGSNVNNSVNVTVKLNGCVLREVKGRPGELALSLMKNPFSGIYQGDSIHGVFSKFNFGFLSNNLLGLFATRLVTSDSHQVKQRESQAGVGLNSCDLDIKSHPISFYSEGTAHPVLGEIVRDNGSKQCWV